ncbi:MAG: efflux RND transporter periplasmic adaptor subunit [Cyanobacteriota bacterium]
MKITNILTDKKALSVYIIAIIAIFIGLIYFYNISINPVDNHLVEHNKNDSLHSTHKIIGSEEFIYICPMHPGVKSEKPGVCPVCNMKLVKKKLLKVHSEHSENTKQEKTDSEIMSISLSPNDKLMANVKTAHPVIKSVNKEIEAFGVITYDTNKLSKVPTWIGGRLDQLYIKAVGDVINKGEIIATIYSPELISAEKEYLYSLQNLQEIENSQLSELVSSYTETIKAAQQRLKYFGLSEQQILSIKSLDDIKDSIPVYSKYSGTVIDIHVLEGNYLKEGEILFTLADFSTVWVEAQVEETNLSEVKLNQSVEIIIDSYPDKLFTGKIDYIYPFMDSDTRTIKIRALLKNPDLMFKPDMYAKVLIKSNPKTLLTIPKSAVFQTGKKAYVWKEDKPGLFQMQQIKIGKSFDSVFEVYEGLQPDDKVAISGGFLIDSEAQLNKGLSGGHNH